LYRARGYSERINNVGAGCLQEEVRNAENARAKRVVKHFLPKNSLARPSPPSIDHSNHEHDQISTIMASSNNPTQIFADDVIEEKGENARLSAFVGAIAVGDLVKSTLGPKGMDKILQSAYVFQNFTRKDYECIIY
jgi:hypothetical protein